MSQTHSRHDTAKAAAAKTPHSGKPTLSEPMSARLGSLKMEKPSFRADMQMARRRGGKRRWIVAGSIVLLLALAVLGYRKNWLTMAGASFVDTPVDVLAVTVGQQDDGEAAMSLSGYVVAESKIQVSAKVSGTVLEVPIEEGSKVKKGDLLVRIDSQTYEADLRQAHAAVKIAEAHLAELKQGSRDEELEQLRANLEQAMARRDLGLKEKDRAEKLEGTISQAEMDKARFSVREAEAFVKQLRYALKLAENGARAEQLAAAEAEVERTKALAEKAQYLFDCTRVVSEFEGTVLTKSVQLGESVRIDPISGTTPVCVIANLNNMLAEIDVPERDLNLVSVGQACKVAPEIAPDNVYEARVERRAPIVNRQRDVVQLKIRILEPDDRLMPDMSCKVTFLREPSKDDSLLRVPRQAVIKEGDTTTVFVLDNDVARRRVVQIGEARDQTIEIASGIERGDKVLLSKQPLVDGQPVRYRLQ